MTQSMRIAGSLAVAITLAVPVAAWAQAVPRNSGSSSSGSSGSSGAGSGASTGGSSNEGTRVSPPSGANGGSMFPDTPSRIPRSSSSPSRTGGEQPVRVAPPPGGVASVSAIEPSAPAARSRVSSSAIFDPNNVAKIRDDQPVRGIASARPVPGVVGGSDFVSFPFYGPWGSYYPWCYSGFGWGFGFVYYDPWFYGPTSWYWGRYGMWYDPYAYFWDPYVSVGGYGGGSSSGSSESSRKTESGSLRIKANVSTAKVYIDNALVGVVDEFDGLANHLELEPGMHALELRADGYATVKKDVEVPSGKTKTVRLELKKAGGGSK